MKLQILASFLRLDWNSVCFCKSGEDTFITFFLFLRWVEVDHHPKEMTEFEKVELEESYQDSYKMAASKNAFIINLAQAKTGICIRNFR